MISNGMSFTCCLDLFINNYFNRLPKLKLYFMLQDEIILVRFLLRFLKQFIFNYTKTIIFIRSISTELLAKLIARSDMPSMYSS